MKRLLIFLLPFILMLGAGCLKKSDSANATFLVPQGTYAGQFMRLRYNTTKGKYDTLKASLTLTMSVATGYKVTGDTSAHAGSAGDFTIDPNYILFYDNTYSKTSTSTKVRLFGTYGYTYDGSILKFSATSADTLGYFYNFIKQ